MNFSERESVLFMVEELESMILGDFKYTEEYTTIKKNRRQAIKIEGE
jgi:hypothetical protein